MVGEAGRVTQKRVSNQAFTAAEIYDKRVELVASKRVSLVPYAVHRFHAAYISEKRAEWEGEGNARSQETGRVGQHGNPMMLPRSPGKLVRTYLLTSPDGRESLPASLTLRVAILADIESTPGKKSHRQSEVANGQMSLSFS
ncbi:hypothetical protein MMC30_006134 [Trapelia coarctata]|nr:hypothetical protein [Trapelia coarctata]